MGEDVRPGPAGQAGREVRVGASQGVGQFQEPASAAAHPAEVLCENFAGRHDAGRHSALPAKPRSRPSFSMTGASENANRAAPSGAWIDSPAQDGTTNTSPRSTSWAIAFSPAPMRTLAVPSKTCQTDEPTAGAIVAVALAATRCISHRIVLRTSPPSAGLV